jgi:hypothetical protein
MEALKLTRHVDSETLHLPELRAFLGKDVEIIVREAASATVDDAEAARYPLRGSVLWDDGDPFAPAVSEEDWEVYR